MSKQFRLELPYPPSVNTLWVNNRRGGKSVSSEHVQYRHLVKALTRLQIIHQGGSVNPLLGKIRLTIDAYRPRRRGDLDNVLKTLIDGLQGTAFRNDEQVVQIVASRYDDARNPRVEVIVELVNG